MPVRQTQVRSQDGHFSRTGYFGCLGQLLLLVSSFTGVIAYAQEQPQRPEAVPAKVELPQPKPIGQFLTLNAPIDDAQHARVGNTLLTLRTQAEQEQRDAYLILQIGPGASPIHQVQGLARLLTSPDFRKVKTVAWIPETVLGPHTLLALACRDIVMHPEAELGDIGRGQPLEPEDRQFALGLAQKRHNPRVTPALVQGLSDREAQLWRIRVRNPETDKVESRVVSRDELETLRQTNVAIDAADVVKERGAPPVFLGSLARTLDTLVTYTAENKNELAEEYGLPTESMKEAFSDLDSSRVRLIRVVGPIDTVLESFLHRQIDRALQGGAQVLIFEIDSPGGLLVQSLNLAQTIAQLDPSQVRTVAYIPDMALSGAAIVALGCDEIYMHPTAKFGDAGVIFAQGPESKFDRVPEKLLSPIRVGLQGLAEAKQRPVALVEAMADRKLIVYQVAHRDSARIWYMSEAEIAASNGDWIQGPQVRETNGELLLTVDGRRAHELKLAESPVTDLDALKGRLGIPGTVRVVPVEQNWADTLVFILNSPSVTVMLLVAGVALLYLELHFFTGLLGIGSVLCFALFFWSRFLGGTADWLEVILFVLGVGCLILEFTVIPGFGVFGVSGILLVLSSLVLAIQTFGNVEPNYDLRQFGASLGMVLGSLAVVGLFATAMARFLPNIPLFEQLILTPPDPMPATDTLFSAKPIIGPYGDLIGRQGTALTVLRPAGKLQLGDSIYDVMSDGGFVTAGQLVEVVSVQGSEIRVRPV